MKKVIVAQIVGGLGNQMFQYAAAKALARKTGASLQLDISGFEKDPLRNFEMDTLNVKAEIASPELIEKLKDTKLRRRLKRLLGPLVPSNQYTEPHFHFDERFKKLEAPIYLSGYFQSEKYFSEMAEELRREFQPRAPLTGENLKIAEAIQSAQGKAVSLHVRRGDYANDEHTMKAHGLTPLEYYRKALELIHKDIGACQLFVFSDDPAWTQENLKAEDPMVFVTNNQGKGIEDLRLMTLCDHHIIANSSFSWWGAWLNPKKPKRVYAPARWFHGLPHNTKDLIPEGWQKI